MADIQLQIGAEEQVSAAARKAAQGLEGLEAGLGATTNAAGKTTAATEKLVKAEDALGSSVVVANQALEIGAKVFGVASRAASAFASYVQAGAQEAISAEKAQRQLSAALGAGTDRITAMTAAIQRRTGADADAMNQQAATLAAMGLTVDQIERAIPALRAYAEVTGKDASRAVMALGKAFEEGKVDQKIEALAQFIPAAEAATDTFGGTVERLTRNLGELQEEIGSSVVESEQLRAVLDETDATIVALTGSVEGLGPLLGDQLAAGAQEAAEGVAVLAGVMADLIDPSEGVTAQLTNLIPGVLGLRVVTGLFASDEAVAVADGLRTMSERTAEYSKRLGEAREKTEELMSVESPAQEAARLAADTERAERAAEERARKAAERREKEAAKRAEDAVALAARLKQIDAANEYNIREAVGESLDKAEEERAKEDAKRAAERTKRIRAWWADQQKIDAARAKEDEDLRRSSEAAFRQSQQNILDTIGNVGAYASMGSSAMQAFAAGMAAESTSDKVKGILAGVLQVIGGIVGFAATGGNPAGLLAGAGAGGAVGGFISSLPFRDGGAVAGYELPKARGGAMILGETDRDGRLVEAHSGEVILSREGVARAGGMQAAARLNDPNAPGPVNRGGHTTINVVALDPMTAVGVIQKSVEPAQTQRLRARAGAQYRKELQRAARGARSGGSL